jgi:hypothetical protein
LRITVGTAEDVAAVIEAATEFMKTHG